MAESPQSPDIGTMLQSAVEFHQRGQLAQAEALYRAILDRAPEHFDALHLLGVIAYQLRNFDAAMLLIGRALRVNPQDASAHSNIGNALRSLDRHEEALASYDRALAVRPDYPEALNNRGNALGSLGRRVEALASYDRAVAIKPDYADALNSRGDVLRGLGRHEEALASYDRALAVRPNHAEALYNRGNALRSLERPEEALASYDRALALKPDQAEVLNDRGIVLFGLRQLGAALASYDRALTLKPDYAEALNNRGAGFLESRRRNEALADFDRALALKPDYADALDNRGNVLQELKRYEEAVRDFERLLIARPNSDYLRGKLLHARNHCCDWRDYDRSVERVESDVAAGLRAISPFAFLSISASPGAQLRCAASFIRGKYPAARTPIGHGDHRAHDKIRIAYLSADFHEHAISYLMAELFEIHDRSRFATTALSSGPAGASPFRARLEQAFDRFIDVKTESDRDVALLMRKLEIDIAIDLNGLTRGGRPGILAFRPAPIQVNYLGFPGTMGADYIDYILADRHVIPAEQSSFYAEQIVYLPDTYQPNDSKRRIGEPVPSRAEAGLPETGFVFCSFSNTYKITPPVFDVWMRLLGQVEGSVLWLLGDTPVAMDNLRRNAEARGIAPQRLIFAPRMTLEDHLARHRLAGFLLDTLPYNAHTTTSDALWAGLPVVTCQGSSFAGRVAGSLLRAAGLPELITESLEDYEALALDLARDETRLAAIKAKLAHNRESCPLFDAARFRRHIESAYETMWARHLRGERPAGFAVAPVESR
jgi:protein O-GlcNAc transferase